MALPVKIASCFGVLESMKSQTPSTKLQTNLKFQYWSSGLPTLRAGPQFQMTKTQNKFRISNFGHCYLFDICYLEFLVPPADCRKRGKTIEAPSGISPEPGPSPHTGIFDRFQIFMFFFPDT
jgi:hypothetical protein